MGRMRRTRWPSIILTVLTVAITLGVVQPTDAAVSRDSAPPSGTITMADWQFPDSCNLITAGASPSDPELCAGVWDNLFLVDDTLHVQADLSDGIPTVANGGVSIVDGSTVVTYTLKPDLRWSDGSPLTMDDVVFSYDLNTALGNPYGLPTVGITETSPLTLKVAYTGRVANYLTDGSPQILPRAYLERKYGTSDIRSIAAAFSSDLYNSPSDVFSGPYMIGAWTPGESVTLVPNPYYTALPADPSHPRAARIQFPVISGSEPGLAAALASGASGIDVAEDLSPQTLPVVEHSSYSPVVSPTTQDEHLELNLDGVLGDLRLRQALRDAIPLDDFFRALYPSMSTADPFIPNSVIPRASPWNDACLPTATYDPDEAKALLAAAGYATSTDPSAPGRHLSLLLATTPTFIRQLEVELLEHYWGAIGVTVQPRFVSGDPSASGGLFSPWSLGGVLAHRAFDVALFTWNLPVDPADAPYPFNPALIPSAAGHDGVYENYTGITDTVQWNLLQQADQTFDDAQRARLLDQWQQAIDAEVPWIMLYARPRVSATDGLVGNYTPNPAAGTSNEWNMYQWYRAASPSTPVPAPSPSPVTGACPPSPTATPIPSATDTPPASPTDTPSASPTRTPLATDTPSPTYTATPTATPNVPTPTTTATETPLPPATATGIPPRPTNTMQPPVVPPPPAPTATATATSSPASTAVPVGPSPAAPTPVPSLAATRTPQPSMATATATPLSAMPSQTPFTLPPPSPTAVREAPTVTRTPSPLVRSPHTKAPVPRHRPRRLPLAVRIHPTRVRSSSTLALFIHTAPRARIQVSLQVTRTRTIKTRKGQRPRHVTMVLYSLRWHGMADKHGRAVRALPITYRAAVPMVGHLAIAVADASGSARRDLRVVILPHPRQHTHRAQHHTRSSHR